MENFEIKLEKCICCMQFEIGIYRQIGKGGGNENKKKITQKIQGYIRKGYEERSFLLLTFFPKLNVCLSPLYVGREREFVVVVVAESWPTLNN